MGRYKIGQRVMIVFPANRNIGLQGVVASLAYVRKTFLRGVEANRIGYDCDWADGDHKYANECSLAPIDDKPESVDTKHDEEITA